MQYTPPWDIFNAKKIILKLDLFHAKFEENRYEMPKIESENQFITSIKGHNSALICRNLSICNTKTLLFNINSYTQFEEIGKGMPKIKSENKSRAITLYLFVKIYPSAIREHSFTISTIVPNLKKIGKGMQKIESENQFLTSIKGCNSVLICQNLPICNPRTLLPNINSHI